MPAHLWKTTVSGHFAFYCLCRCKSVQRRWSGVPAGRALRAARCLQNQRIDELSALCFKRQLGLCAVRGNAHKRFAFQQSGGQREPYPAGGLRQAACGFKGHAQVFPIRPCGHILRKKTAAVSPRRCGFDHFQLRSVFCLPAHGAEGQGFAFRSAESKLPAIRAASVRTAISQTIGALRAGSVRGPCTKLVSQLIGRVCGVAVFAAGAGKNSIAVCFTGRLYGNSLIIMVQRGQFRIGGIVAAGAGIVSPAFSVQVGACAT